MEYGMKTKIAKATGKSISFISQYFNIPGKKMSWDTSKKAAEAFPTTLPQWWADKDINSIEQALSKNQEAA